MTLFGSQLEIFRESATMELGLYIVKEFWTQLLNKPKDRAFISQSAWFLHGWLRLDFLIISYRLLTYLSVRYINRNKDIIKIYL